MSFQSLMNQTAIIKRAVTTVDEMGGEGSVIWAVIHRRVPCRINYPKILSRSSDMIISYDKQSIFADAIIYTKYLSGVYEGDRFYIGNKVFEIKLIQDVDELKDYMRFACKQEK